MTIKTCVTCKHYVLMEYPEDQCRKFQTLEIDPVRGTRVMSGMRECRSERLSYMNVQALTGRQKCGPSGTFWEPKEEQSNG